MQEFKVNEKLTVECKMQYNKKGFKHVATLKLNGYEVLTTRTQYYNRTWESYQYESILRQLADRIEYKKILTKNELSLFRRFIKNPQRVEDDLKPLKSISALATLGGLMSNNKKDSNKHKLNILKMSLGDTFIIPDDWEDLPEDEKGKRLDKVIKQLGK